MMNHEDEGVGDDVWGCMLKGYCGSGIIFFFKQKTAYEILA